MKRTCGPCGGTGEIWLVLTNQAAECPHCRGYGTVRDEADNEGGGYYLSEPPEPFTISDKDTLGRGGIQ